MRSEPWRTPSARSGSTPHHSSPTSRACVRSALRETGDLEGAREQLALALTIARRQRLLYEEEQTLRASADLASFVGREDEMREALDEADRLAQRLAEMS